MADFQGKFATKTERHEEILSHRGHSEHRDFSQAGVLASTVFTKQASVKPLSSSTEPLYSVSFKLTNFDSLLDMD